MARPRGGNFVYTQKVCKQMLEDVKMIGKIKENHEKKGLIEGVVVGVLEKDNQSICKKVIQKTVEIAEGFGMYVVFHMAFDEISLDN